MCERFEEWKNDISAYCAANGLSFEKASQMIKCSNSDMLVLQYFDANSESAKKGLGLLDETLMPVVLWVKRKGTDLIFEQTENTRKYLAR